MITLYSCTRYDYYNYHNFVTGNHDFVYLASFMGYFQLYKHSKNKYMYQESSNCRDCNFAFAHRFANKILLPGKIQHLGKDIVNHLGRKSKEDFKY